MSPTSNYPVLGGPVLFQRRHLRPGECICPCVHQRGACPFFLSPQAREPIVRVRLQELAELLRDFARLWLTHLHTHA